MHPQRINPTVCRARAELSSVAAHHAPVTLETVSHHVFLYVLACMTGTCQVTDGRTTVQYLATKYLITTYRLEWK